MNNNIGKSCFETSNYNPIYKRLRCVSCDLRECVCVNVNLFVRYFYTRRRRQQRRNIYFSTHEGELTTLIFYLSIFCDHQQRQYIQSVQLYQCRTGTEVDQQKCVNCLCKSVCKLSALRHLDEYMQNEISSSLRVGVRAGFGCCACLDSSKSDVTCECTSEIKTAENKTSHCVYNMVFCFSVALFVLCGSLRWTVHSVGGFTVALLPFASYTLSHLHRHSHRTRQFTWTLEIVTFFCVSSTSKCNHCSVCNTLFCLKRKTSFLFVYSLAGVWVCVWKCLCGSVYETSDGD